jgi:excisionase family DNA binding protein
LGRRDSEKVKHERPMTAIEQSSLPRVEHDARDAAYLQSHPRLQSALLAYKEGLLGYKEALQKFDECLNGDESQPPNGQSLRLLSLSEVCQELGEERVVVDQRLRSGEIPALKLGDALKVRQADLKEYMKYMKRQPHLRLVGEEDSFRER